MGIFKKEPEDERRRARYGTGIKTNGKRKIIPLLSGEDLEKVSDPAKKRYHEAFIRPSWTGGKTAIKHYELPAEDGAKYEELQKKLLAVTGTSVQLEEEVPFIDKILRFGQFWIAPAPERHYTSNNADMSRYEVLLKRACRTETEKSLCIGFVYNADTCRWMPHVWLIKRKKGEGVLVEGTLSKGLYYGYILSEEELDETDFTLKKQPLIISDDPPGMAAGLTEEAVLYSTPDIKLPKVTVVSPSSKKEKDIELPLADESAKAQAADGIHTPKKEEGSTVKIPLQFGTVSFVLSPDERDRSKAERASYEEIMESAKNVRTLVDLLLEEKGDETAGEPVTGKELAAAQAVVESLLLAAECAEHYAELYKR